jgi:hypothetical protein
LQSAYIGKYKAWGRTFDRNFQPAKVTFQKVITFASLITIPDVDNFNEPP